MYFHTDNVGTMGRLRLALANADKIRFSVDSAGRLKFKVGEGMWSEPIPSTPDPYRDPQPSPEWRHLDQTLCSGRIHVVMDGTWGVCDDHDCRVRLMT